MRFVSVHVVHLYSSIDTVTAWKKSRFILSDRSDFHIIDNLSITVYAFMRRVLTSLSVDETLLPRHVNLSTNFRCSPLRVDMAHSRLKHVFCCIYVHVEASASCCLLQAMQQWFGLGMCICKKRFIICIVCVCYSFWRISSVSCFFLA